MKKRLFIVHGWGGSPSEPLIAWLGNEGNKIGFETNVLEMPHTDTPTISDWINYIKLKVQYLDENTYFIGHSIGCQAILRYLELQDNVKIGTAIFIAPWLILTAIEAEEDNIIAKPWVETPIDFEKIKKVISKCVMIFSDNDPYVPFKESQELFKKNLGPKIIVEHNKGHFTQEDGVVDLPIAIQELI
jgi:hypothetical protein